MENGQRQDVRERKALLGLWAIPGLGVVHLDALRHRVGGRLSELLDEQVDSWSELLPPTQASMLRDYSTLARLSEGVREAADRSGIQIAWEDDESYPRLLLDLEDPPPVLFHLGQVGLDRRRVAMVGTRNPDPRFVPRARELACEVAKAGVGIVSGAASGIDRTCHDAALWAGGETWAFLASGLDEIDAPQARVSERILEGGGRIFSEYPPKIRAEKPHFPRRNRLIAGAADATLVLRAPRVSGSLYTAGVAHRLGRPVLSVPGELWQPEAEGCNALISEGARLCRGRADVLKAVGLVEERSARQEMPGRSMDELGISPSAQKVYGALNRAPLLLEEVLGETRLDPAVLSSALCELELRGLAVQHPGRLYEKV